MKFKNPKYFIVIFTILSIGCSTISRNEKPFSLTELNADPQLIICEADYYETSDNIDLAYYKYQPESAPRQSLIFIHGGGACSRLGYQYLAETLSKKYKTTVYLFDMRGHGLSEGKRGDAPKKERIWQDISEFIDYVKSEINGIPIYLGGHSSGGGLVLNYATWKKRNDVNGYIFVSPKFGYRSNTDRYPFLRDPFANAHIGTIIVNIMSNGLFNSHAVAVELNYSQDLMYAEPLIVNRYTCNVVNAITPRNPEKQFRIIDRPFYLCIGEYDELMLAENTIEIINYVDYRIQIDSIAKIIPEQNHLGILRITGELIGSYLKRSN